MHLVHLILQIFSVELQKTLFCIEPTFVVTSHAECEGVDKVEKNFRKRLNEREGMVPGGELVADNTLWSQ